MITGRARSQAPGPAQILATPPTRPTRKPNTSRAARPTWPGRPQQALARKWPGPRASTRARPNPGRPAHPTLLRPTEATAAPAKHWPGPPKPEPINIFHPSPAFPLPLRPRRSGNEIMHRHFCAGATSRGPTTTDRLWIPPRRDLIAAGRNTHRWARAQGHGPTQTPDYPTRPHLPHTPMHGRPGHGTARPPEYAEDPRTESDQAVCPAEPAVAPAKIAGATETTSAILSSLCPLLTQASCPAQEVDQTDFLCRSREDDGRSGCRRGM